MINYLFLTLVSPDIQMHLSLIEMDYLNNNPDVADALLDHLASEEREVKEFGRWAVEYLTNNPTVSFETFQNWFMGESEGQDGEYDSEYWDNPNLTFPQQNLPSWSDFEAAFPKKNGGYMKSSQVYELVGGTLYQLHLDDPQKYGNACAIRVSRALNYSGINVPAISGQTVKGGDGKNYFLGAANLNAWMLKTFGNPSTHLTGSQGGKYGQNFPSLLSNKKGIYIMIPNYPAYFASGHADVWNGEECNGSCYFDIEEDLPNNKRQGVAYINLWQLN